MVVEVRTQNIKNRKSTVFNLSQLVLDDHLKSLLEKGLNYAISPTKIPINDVISNIEVAIKNTDQDVAEEIRQDVAKILRRAKPPSRNISKDESLALNNIRKNKNIIILKANKGNTIILMDRSEELNYLFNVLKNNGYEENIIHKTIKSSTTKTQKRKLAENPKTPYPI